MSDIKTNYILLTRPSSDSLKLQKQLQVPTLVSPMLTVKKLANKLRVPPQTTDIIITSARIFELYPEVAALPYRFWCVSGVSATIARTLGIKNLKSASGTVRDLIIKISQEVDCEESYLVHLSGETLYKDVIAELAHENFKGERLTLYSAESVTQLTPEVIDAFKQQQIKVTAFYSYKSAATFADLVEKNQLNDGFKSCFCLTLSENIAAAVEHLPWQQLIVKSDLSAADLQEFYMKQVPQEPKVKASSVTPLLGSAVVGGLGAALTLFIVQQLNEPVAVNLSSAQLEPFVTQLNNLEARLLPPDTTLASRVDELTKTIEELKAHQPEQASKEDHEIILRTQRLAQTLVLENTLAKLSNPNSSSNELEQALNLLISADVPLDDNQRQLFSKRPLISLSHLLATFPIIDPPPKVGTPLPENIKKYLGDIKIERLNKSGRSIQPSAKLLVQDALQSKNYSLLREILGAKSEQPDGLVWLENVTTYFTLIQTLNDIQKQLHSS